MPDPELPWEERLAGLVEEVLAARADAATPARQKQKLEGRLDELWWERADALVAGRVASERDTLDFSDEERLLLDVGLLDPALVEGAGADLPARLLEELAIPGPATHLHLSEWLEDRYRRHRLAFAVDAEEKRTEHGAAEDETRQTRTRLLQRLAPLFEGLPGVPAEVARFYVAGGLEEQVLQADLACLEAEKRRPFLHRRRLLNLRAQILEKARARTRGPADLKLFDSIDDLYARGWREAWARRGSGLSGQAEEMHPDGQDRDGLVEYLRGELRFIRTLFPLGALAGGAARTCAALLRNGRRVTKADTAQGLRLAQSCDRGFAFNPVVLIAPFRGRGIFEWDRDSLVVPLDPSADPLDAVAHAAANYRMLMDAFQGDGELRKAYEQALPGNRFQQAFPADYRAWLTRVAHGDGAALPTERFVFFRDHIGPDVRGVLAPPGLAHLGPQARDSIRRRLEKQVALGAGDPNLYRRLGVLQWQEGDLDGAIRRMAAAAGAAPKDGEILFSLGLLLRAKGQGDRAAKIFDACAQRVSETLWGVYAGAAARGEI